MIWNQVWGCSLKKAVSRLSQNSSSLDFEKVRLCLTPGRSIEWDAKVTVIADGTAHESVEHDDVNVIAMGAWIADPNTATDIATTYLTATFSGSEDFSRRVGKLLDPER